MAKTKAQQDGDRCNRRGIKIYTRKITRQIASTNASSARAKLLVKIDAGKASVLCGCMSGRPSCDGLAVGASTDGLDRRRLS